MRLSYHMKNFGDRGEEGVICRDRRAEAENTLRDLLNSSYDTKAEFNNRFIIHSN